MSGVVVFVFTFAVLSWDPVARTLSFGEIATELMSCDKKEADESAPKINENIA